MKNSLQKFWSTKGPTRNYPNRVGGRFLTAFAACLFTILAKGVLIGLLAAEPGEWMTVTEKTTYFLILSLPPLFMAVLTTIGFTRDSLKIFLYKAELIIMPIGTYNNLTTNVCKSLHNSVSFFSFSKTKLCQQKDGRVLFSPLFSIINIIISTICSAGVLAKIWTNDDISPIPSPIIPIIPLINSIIPYLVPHLLGVLFSLMFIFYDKICCCCCECCLGAEERIVYDPSHPDAQLQWKSGKVLYLDRC